MKAIIAGPVTLALCYRAYAHKSLTPAGIVAAAITAIAHALHPWNLPFVLLCVFYLAGTRVTKIKKDVKATLTEHSKGGSGGEGPRTHIQVFANSFVSSVLTLLHAYQLRNRDSSMLNKACYMWSGDLLVIGIIANYAAVAADTFSSELGILSTHAPRLVTSLTLRKVPRGTNGGVTLWGLLAGVLGSMVITTASMLFLPFCPILPDASPLLVKGLEGGRGWGQKERQYFAFAMVAWGALGSVLDSFLGGWLQQSVIDTRTGRIVEGDGGKKVLVSKDGVNSMHFEKRAEVKSALQGGEGKQAVEKTQEALSKEEVEEKLDGKMGGVHRRDSRLVNAEPSRVVESGLGLLDNNEVNFLMALTMSLGAMGLASWAWGVPMQSAFLLQ